MKSVVQNVFKDLYSYPFFFIRSDGDGEECNIAHDPPITRASVKHAVENAETAEDIYLAGVIVYSGTCALHILIVL